MTIYGREEPVLMPSMGVYNTDTMKLYMTEVKDQYEKAREEMKDFMKLYLDFYSDVPGDTERYYNMTIGGAKDMINLMMANGIDPFKSPEARAAIGRYIASVPVGKANEMKRSAENAKEYKRNLAKAMQDPNFDPEYNRARIGGDLDTWNSDPSQEWKPWTATTPYIAPSMIEFASPYMEKFKQSEILDSDRPGYLKKGTTDKNQQAAINAVISAMSNSDWGRYKIAQAQEAAMNATDGNGNPLSPEDQLKFAQEYLRNQVADVATQYFQPAYEADPYAKMDYQHRLSINEHEANNASDWKYKEKELEWYLNHGNPKNLKTGEGSGRTGNNTSKEKYSHYAALDNAHARYMSERLSKRLPAGTTVTDEAGNKLRVVKFRGKDGQLSLAIEDPNGPMRGKNGKNYRYMAGDEMQRLTLSKSNKDTWMDDMSVYDVPQTISTIFSEADTKNPSFLQDYKDFIYSPDMVARHMVGGGAGFYSSETPKTNKEIRDNIKGLSSNGFATKKYMQVYLKNGNLCSYVPIKVKIDGKDQLVLFKIDEREPIAVGNDIVYVPTGKWEARRGASDRLTSKEIVGQTNAEDLTTSDIETED